MIVIEPIALGDPKFSGGGGSFWDKRGMLQAAPPNTLRVTYDPADLSKAPYALIEKSKTNFIRNNTLQGAVTGVVGTGGLLPTHWGVALGSGLSMGVVEIGMCQGMRCMDLRIYGTPTTGSSGIRPESLTSGVPAAANQILAYSVFMSLVSGRIDPSTSVRLSTVFYDSNSVSFASENAPRLDGLISAKLARYSHISAAAPEATVSARSQILIGHAVGIAIDFTIRICAPQSEDDEVTSVINTSGTAVTRAADVVGPGAGLVYSNVPITEPAYDTKTSYAKDALVHEAGTYRVFQSVTANNLGKDLADTAAWSPRGVVNRRAMFDEYNNTQTVMPDEIIVVLTPEMVAQGLYLGNLDVDEVRVSMADATEGLIYSSVTDLIESNSNSSFFNWMFKRIKRRSYFFTLDLPVYSNGLITICLPKAGASAKCGMCAIGPVDDFGPSLLGLSTEGKDFSSTTFNFDGTSKTTIRPYAKRMSCDVVIENDQITYVQDRLFELRQRPMVWVGGPYGAAAVFGRYGSFKNVIEYQMQSRMNLIIEGAV